MNLNLSHTTTSNAFKDTNNYTTQSNHPLIPNANDYLYYNKYVSIHSEDRDILKYPKSNSFEIEMPEDLLNVSIIKLTNWTFPSNYSQISKNELNTYMTFKITNPFNPKEQGIELPLQQAIYDALMVNVNNDENYLVDIPEGFYNPEQMCTTLTATFNQIITNYLLTYFQDNNQISFLNEFIAMGGYQNFNIVYNVVSQKIWFGNNADAFVLTNLDTFLKKEGLNDVRCQTRTRLPSYANWGLPAFLGLPKLNTPSKSCSIINKIVNDVNIDDKNAYIALTNPCNTRFYYDEDGSNWLLPNPNLPGSVIHWVEAEFKINLMGPAYMYLEIEGLNCIDETAPFNASEFTSTTNITNGIVNSAFAKIAIPTTPISQWFDRDALPYKEYTPPAERMRRLKLKLRYHDGMLVDFGLFDWSIMLEFRLLVPQQIRKYNHTNFVTRV